MKKKGFTLVELLAVIVILAIIALIAIPLIGNVIEKAKIGALESSVNGLVESANMYYANNTIKGETIIETIFDFKDGEQVSDKKLEYKGKVYNGKLILHANGEAAVCIDDEEHYAYKNKDTDEIVSGVGTCVYDGTTGDFSSNSSINDLRGKTLVATQIEKNGDNAIITIPEEGHVDTTSKISIPTDIIINNLNAVSNMKTVLRYETTATGTPSYTLPANTSSYFIVFQQTSHSNGGGVTVTNATRLEQYKLTGAYSADVVGIYKVDDISLDCVIRATQAHEYRVHYFAVHAIDGFPDELANLTASEEVNLDKGSTVTVPAGTAKYVFAYAHNHNSTGDGIKALTNIDYVTPLTYQMSASYGISTTLMRIVDTTKDATFLIKSSNDTGSAFWQSRYKLLN